VSSRGRVLIFLGAGVGAIAGYGWSTDSPFVGIYLAVTVVLTVGMVGIDRAVVRGSGPVGAGAQLERGRLLQQHVDLVANLLGAPIAVALIRSGQIGSGGQWRVRVAVTPEGCS
jgi:hypothetical protein